MRGVPPRTRCRLSRTHLRRSSRDADGFGQEWKGTDDYVFTNAWGEPVHPDTVSSLMADLIKTHNQSEHSESPAAHCRTLGCTTCATFMPPPCK
jgi:hypothetical protein